MMSVQSVKHALRLALLILLLSIVAFPAAAQDADSNPFAPIGDPAEPGIFISFPPPIYLLSGQVEIRGTVNVPNIRGYFLETRPLRTDFTPDVQSAWTPVSLLSNRTVVDNVLATWDTTLFPDGAYELRLNALVAGGRTFRVSPVRIENEPPAFVIQRPPVAFPTFAPPAATLAPLATVSNDPRVTNVTRVDVNVREGDSTLYPIISRLPIDASAEILGVSNRGTGWYQIRLDNGRIGWVSPTVVSVTGDVRNLPLIAPPPLPATATPTLTPTPNLADLTISNVRFNSAPFQGVPFQIIVTVFNASPVPVTFPFAVACNIRPQGIFSSTDVFSLGAFTQVDVALNTQVNTGGGASITAECAADVNNVIPELNDSNNFFNLTVTLNP